MGAQAACAENVELRSTELRYQGHPGMWFDARVAKCLLEDVHRAKQLSLQVSDYEAREGAQDQFTDLLERQLALAIQETAVSDTGMQTAIRLRIDAEEKLRSPRRNPALWFGLGLITAGAAAALTATLTK
jgi:hypothetical protein